MNNALEFNKKTAMTTPLINHLKFDGMNKYGNDILLGISVETPQLDPYTRMYLNQLSTITRSLHDQAYTISLEEYIK